MDSEERKEGSEAAEMNEFFDLVEPALGVIQERFGGTKIEALQAYLMLGMVSELKMFRSFVTESPNWPMGSMSREDMAMFMETLGAKPN